MRDVLHADTIALLTALRPTTAKAADAREATLRLLADGPVAMTRAHRPGHVTASTLVVDAAGERVLLCLHGKIGRWMQVGGHCEAGDKTLVAAALREATEESGIAGLVVGAVPIDVDVHPVGCHGGSLHHDVRFAAVAPPEAVERVSEESAALGWFAPDALPEPLAHATAELVAPALAWVRRTRSHPAP